MEKVNRFDFLGLPIDIVRPENLEEVLFKLIEQPGTKQIFFLTIWDVLKAKFNLEYRLCIQNASLVLPVSKSLATGLNFLYKTKAIRYYPFKALVQFFTILEHRYKSLYLLGGHPEMLFASEKNIRNTFKSLQVVGRVPGYFSPKMEKDILLAIFKANPSMVLIGDGIKQAEKWIYERRNTFSSSIFVYYKDAYAIFSQKKKKLSEKSFEKGREIWFQIARNPLKVFLIFPYILYLLMLIGAKLFNKK